MNEEEEYHEDLKKKKITFKLMKEEERVLWRLRKLLLN